MANQVKAPKKLPLYISNFPEMIEENYVYVDKTEQIYHLAKEKGYYFLSRPRRFGKSLLVSTLKALYSGKKSLFKDLWIGSSDYEWQEYPVVHLDFSGIAHKTAQQLEQDLVRHLQKIADEYSLNIILNLVPESALDQLITALSKINKVVILIDEYDKPILDHIKNIEQAKEQQLILKGFYDTIKSLGQHLHAVLLTGVSRFSQTSLFSGINNLNDLSLKPEAAELLGYTHEEIQHYFKPHIDAFAHYKHQSSEEITEKLQKWYNGYRFSEKETKVYNPFSVLYALHDKRFMNYWFTSGTPTFLVHLLKKEYENIENIEDIKLSAHALGNFEIDNIPLIPLLLQTGYLTLADYNEETNNFSLKVPNFEVEESFTKFIVTALAQAPTATVETALDQLRTALENNDIQKFCIILETLFAHIPYTISKESYYHALFQFLLSLLALNAQSEILTDKGRIDVAVITKKQVFIFELKVNNSADVALQQIKELRYYERYRNSGKQIVLVGLAFNRLDTELRLEYKEEIVQ